MKSERNSVDLRHTSEVLSSIGLLTDQITSELLHTDPSATPAFRSWWRFGKVLSMDDYLSRIAPLRPSARPAQLQAAASSRAAASSPRTRSALSREPSSGNPLYLLDLPLILL